MKNIFFSIFLLFSAVAIQAQCAIFDLVATPSDCNNGQFFVTINFQYDGVGNEGFKVQGNGNQYGNFQYANLPITLGPFAGNGSTVYEFVARDLQFPDCYDFATVGPINCGTAPCDIFDFVAQPGDCNADGNYSLTIDFQVVNSPHTHFDLIYQGQNIGYYAIADLPITLQNFVDNGEPGQSIKVCINDSDCCAIDEFQAPNCQTGGACDIFDFVIETGDCNADGTYPLTFDFQVENPPHTHFDLIYEGQIIGHYALADLPITIEHFTDNGETGQLIKVCINDSDCCAFQDFQAPDCGANGDCHIYDVVAEANPCDANGQYLLDVAFASQNTGNQGFKIRANDQWYGPFVYGQASYAIGPLNSGVVYEIVVRDVEYELCKAVKVFGPINCAGGCDIYEVTANVSDCNDQGQFFVTIDFGHQNTGDDGFKVYGNGNVYGYFSYDDLPVTIGPLTSQNEELEFGVADASHPDCHDFAVVQVPDCGEPSGGDCNIADLVADVHPCLPNGMFYVTLNFQHENTSGYFKVRGNGNLYGIYSYDDLPVEIGPLLGNGTTPYELVVIDIHNEDCRDDVNVGTVDCSASGDCEVTDLIVDPSECNADDSYNLWFWFNFDNPGNNFYNVFHNNDLVGTYPLTQIPKTLQHLVANDEPLQTLKICINDHPDCCITLQYEAPNCDGLVYPGDGNRDNISNNFDLLNIGLGYGWEGPQRPTQGLEWTGLEAPKWPQFFGDGVNAKHADCTGDGLINSFDVAAILLNFGETNGNTQPTAFAEGSENDPPLFVDLPAASALQPGMSFNAPVMLGTADSPLDDVYGIAFTLKFDPEIINPSSFDLQYDPSWLGVQAVNLLSFDRTLAAEGEVQVSLVRTDHNNVSGHGQIAGIIGIIDNIAGKESISIEIKEVKAIRKNEALVALRKPVEIVDLMVNGSHEPRENALEVFPNPVKNQLNFQLPNAGNAEMVELLSVEGKVIMQTKSGANYLNTSNLGDGVYILRVKSGDKVYQRKILK